MAALVRRRLVGSDVIDEGLEGLPVEGAAAMDKEGEGTLGVLELEALAFQLLDPADDLGRGRAVMIEVEPEAPSTLDDALPAAQLAHENFPLVADADRIDMLIGAGVRSHGMDMHAALVGEGAAPT